MNLRHRILEANSMKQIVSWINTGFCVSSLGIIDSAETANAALLSGSLKISERLLPGLEMNRIFQSLELQNYSVAAE
jgi:hypothetical protein